MGKYRYTFEFVETEEEARRFCERENTTGSAYKRKNKKAHFTPWTSKDGTEKRFICWYYV